MLFLFGLAPSGVHQAQVVTNVGGALLPHHFTLTFVKITYKGGIFSVALALECTYKAYRYALYLNPAGNYPALYFPWSPDFPHQTQAFHATTSHPTLYDMENTNRMQFKNP